MQLIKKENLVYWGIVFFFLVEMTNEVDYFFKINLPVLRYSICSLASYYLIKGTIFSKNSIISEYSILIQFVIYFLTCYSLFIILQDVPTIISPLNNFINLKKTLSGYLAVYLIPLIVYWRLNLNELEMVGQFTRKIGIFYVVITILLFPFFTNPIPNEVYGFSGEAVGAVFGSSVSLILLTFPYHNKKTAIIALLSITLALIVNAILARRNQVAYFISIFIFTFIINFVYKPKGIKQNKFLINLSIILFLIIATFLFFSFQSLFSALFERVDEGFDSREDILNEFVYDFNNKPLDWYLGRGLFGSFNSVTLGDEMASRDGIENGYYQIILKGGFLYIGSFMILSLISIFNGIFNSKNLLSKAFACIVITQYIEMFGFGLPSLTIKYITFWIAVTAGLSPRLYKLSDLEINKIYRL